ncbi:MAG: Actin cross-linking toxin VgrG1 [Pseudomonas sp.]|nr:MAG: Actin cross-linking toxin VgrG1 [Pseudomonas sp.]
MNVGATQHVRVGTAQCVETGRELYYYAGDKVVIDAGMELTARTDGGFVKVDAGGITLSGAQMKVATPPLAMAEELEEEEEEVEQEHITLRIGVFFDGTGNNRSNSERVSGCFAQDVGLADSAEDIRKFCAAYGYDGKGSSPDNSYGNDTSNVAKLYDLYMDQQDNILSVDAKTANLAIYVEGIGTRSIGEDSPYSQGTGLGAQGVRARVKETPALFIKAIRAFQENNPDKKVELIEFNIFGFSRGAAAARNFANEVLKGEQSILAKALPTGAPILAGNFKWQAKKDVLINFIGIYDTVAAIANPLRLDFNGHNANNPGINIVLAPDTAKKVVHLVAKNERRYNFSLKDSLK